MHVGILHMFCGPKLHGRYVGNPVGLDVGSSCVHGREAWARDFLESNDAF
jgi:hypothetical protein